MKKQLFLLSLFALLFGLLSLSETKADVKLPAIFSDHMVLQQQTQVRLWGKASPGEKVTVAVSWRKGKWKVTADADSCWRVEIPTPAASSEAASLTVKGRNTIQVKDILIGEVWLCSGQSNMEFPVSYDSISNWKNGMSNAAEVLQDADYPALRLFRVDHQLAPDGPLDDCRGAWEICTPATAATFSAVGFIFGRKIHTEIGEPVGLIQSTWGGTHAESWMAQECMQGAYYDSLRVSQERILSAYPSARSRYDQERKAYQAARAENPDTSLTPPVKPVSLNANLRMSTLWNGMIHPILPYTIKGVIWYQGESNDSRAAAYQSVFTDLIASWRAAWGEGDFPFYFVQIAPYYKQSPLLREGQLKVWRQVENTGMAVITDAGDSTNIHPRNKVIPGERLAFWALSHDYGRDIPYMGPVYRTMTVNDSVAELSFDYTGSGLTFPGDSLQGFVIAGEEGVFYPATAVVRGDKVEVSAPQVALPVAVRYGWDTFFRVNLYNREGLPATPFRTDDWDL